MEVLVGVRHSCSGQLTECRIDDSDYRCNDMVVVKTVDGSALGSIVYKMEDDQREIEAEVLRLADKQDFIDTEEGKIIEKEAMKFCQERVLYRQLEMNLVAVERMLDGGKMTFFFTAEGRIDFRALVKDLAARFRCRVEMRQIGVRNETKILGGIGSCGRQLCCNTYMSTFCPVSVKMAKEQNLSLNPNKISGLCGRLMCCLAYEFPVYMDCKKDMPKVGKRVETVDGVGKVIRQTVMAGKVTVSIEGKELDYKVDEVCPISSPEQNQEN